MSLTSGTRIGVFEVVSKLGEGGMGEVYRARDTRLDRDVALKVLPDLFSRDPERIARFEREARVLAAVNHPHIAQVYGFEPPATAGEAHAAIAMELVDGHTLQEVLEGERVDGAATGLPLERALAIARQIAAALEAAHDQGIVHRDLKPANIKIRDDGTVKVLDFGLAKAFAADAEAVQSGVAQSPTLTARSTQLGMILGTAAYMSPEQAKGRTVDRRADVWAFGAVLFEMLTGRRAFEGDDVSDVLASVLKSDPDWNALPSELPIPVRRLLRRCLERDPNKRLRDIGEGMLQLDEGLAAPPAVSGIAPADPIAAAKPWWRRAVPIVVTAAATAAIVTAIERMRAPAPPTPPILVRYAHVPPQPLMATLGQRDIAISPDGRTIAYSVTTGGLGPALYIHRLDQLDAAPLRGAQPAIAPFFSPDGQWVGFLDQTSQDQIMKLPVLGGPPVKVIKVEGTVHGASWTADGIVFASRNSPLRIVPDGGGEAVAITSLEASSGEHQHLWPAAVPGTPIVLFVQATDLAYTNQGAHLAAVDRSTGKVVKLNLEGSHPRYVSSGHVVYSMTDGSLRAVRFDARQMAVIGQPVPVLDGVAIKPSGAANFDISENGHLVHAAGGSAFATRTLAWVDRKGQETAIPAPPRNYFYARVSPDGSRISLDVRDQEQDIWLWDIRRDAMTRLTDRPGADQYALWTPDDRLVFASGVGGRPELFRHRTDGVGTPEQITNIQSDGLQPFPNAITPDGKQVVFRAVVGAKNDLFVAEIGSDTKARPLIATPHDERNAALSPAGDFIAFESDVTDGRSEVFVRPFPNVDAAQFRVSTDGGTEPVWSPDGREIFYIASRKLMSVRVTKTPGGLELDRPEMLFDAAPYFFGGAGRNYDVSPDGGRFIMIKTIDERRDQRTPVNIVINWMEELRTRVR